MRLWWPLALTSPFAGFVTRRFAAGDEQERGDLRELALLGQRLRREHLVAVEEAGVDVAGDEVRQVEDLLQIGDVRRHADHAELGERTLHARAGAFAVAAPGRHLGEQRVVVRA